MSVTEIHYDIEREDYARWWLWSTGSHYARQANLLRWFAFVFVGTGLLGVLNSEGDALWATSIIVLSLAGLFYCLLGYRLHRRWHYRRHAADPTFSAPNGRHSLVVTETTISERSSCGTHTLDWRAVTGIVRDSANIYVVGGGVAFIVSNRSYEGPAGFDELVSYLDLLRSKAVRALRKTSLPCS